MTKAEKIYTGLCVLFAALIVLGNLTYKKFITIGFEPFHIFQLSVGAILYPLTFLITNLIAELYNREKAKFCASFGLITNTNFQIKQYYE